jgi:integrase
MQLAEAEATDAYKNFINSLDSEESRLTYKRSFPYFMKFCHVETYDGMLNIPIKQLEGLIRDYLIHLRDDKKNSPSTIATYSAAIAHFYDMNDVTINWKKLKKFKGRMRRVVEDVPYTREQIKTLIDNTTLRNRCMILVMASAGLRRGALPHLRLKDILKVPQYNLYKISVYKKEQEHYITYCTPECAAQIDHYLQWRERLGEKLLPETVLFRTEFNTTSMIRIAKPMPLGANALGRLITMLLDKTGVRPFTQSHSKTNLMQCHGFRKFFDTQCISHNINPLYAEYLMGHKTGIMKSYFKPSDSELLEGNEKSLGYLAMIPYLTINATEEENQRLKQKLVRREQEHSIEWELMREQVDEIKQKMGLC